MSTLQHFPLWKQRTRQKQEAEGCLVHMSWKEFLICVVCNVRKKSWREPGLLSGGSTERSFFHVLQPALLLVSSPGSCLYPSAKRRQLPTVGPGSGGWTGAIEGACSAGLGSRRGERGRAPSRRSRAGTLWQMIMFCQDILFSKVILFKS